MPGKITRPKPTGTTEQERLEQIRKRQLAERYKGTAGKLKYHQFRTKAKVDRKPLTMNFARMSYKGKGLILGALFGLAGMIWALIFYAKYTEIIAFAPIAVILCGVIGMVIGATIDGARK